MRFTLALWLLCGTLLLVPAAPLGQAVPSGERPAPLKPLPYEISLDGLMWAIHDKDVRAVAALLDLGVQVNVYLESHHVTPLMRAVVV
jgi:hypothetical protein